MPRISQTRHANSDSSLRVGRLVDPDAVRLIF